VLSSSEEPAAPVVDFTEPVPVPVAERRPRRRSAGRPAGPPPAQAADESPGAPRPWGGGHCRSVAGLVAHLCVL
ncbi:hypothetical protein, partial [Nocardia cyriacigeorgica]|uniref:hypothetical protein n=1 Tax=Nocardia cyriacigeorgica TaxID=135487 RepID=UPI0024570227